RAALVPDAGAALVAVGVTEGIRAAPVVGGGVGGEEVVEVGLGHARRPFALRPAVLGVEAAGGARAVGADQPAGVDALDLPVVDVDAGEDAVARAVVAQVGVAFDQVLERVHQGVAAQVIHGGPAV